MRIFLICLIVGITSLAIAGELEDKVKEMIAAENDCTVETLADTLVNKEVEKKIGQIKNEIVRDLMKQATRTVVTDSEALPLATEQMIVAVEAKSSREETK